MVIELVSKLPEIHFWNKLLGKSSCWLESIKVAKKRGGMRGFLLRKRESL